jgi:hypothetical protein
MASLLPTTKLMFLGNDGNPLVGGKIYTFDTGTTTPRVTYQDAAGTIPNTNPVILDARGEALIFWSGSYRVRLEDALGNLIWSVDSVSEIILNYRTGSNGSAIIPAGPTASRDTIPQIGYFRYNTDLGQFEGYGNDGWGPVGGGSSGSGATGAGPDQIFQENDTTVTTSYEIGGNAFVSGVTITIASPGVFTLVNHKLLAGMAVRFKTTGTLPTGMTAGTPYWVIATGLSSSTFRVAASYGGTAINLSGGQTGTHSVAKSKNASVVGPLITNSGVTLTVPTGQRLVVL